MAATPGVDGPALAGLVPELDGLHQGWTALRAVARFDACTIELVGADESGLESIPLYPEFRPQDSTLISAECSLAGTVIRLAQPVTRSLDERDSTDWHEAALALDGYRSVCCLPLRAGERVVGALTLLSRGPDSFDSETLQRLSGLAESYARSIRGVQRYRSALFASRRPLVMRALESASMAGFIAASRLNDLLHEAFDFSHVALAHREHDSVGYLWLPATEERFPLAGSLAETVWRSGMPQLVSDLSGASRWVEEGALRQRGARSLMALFVSPDRALVFTSARPLQFAPADAEERAPVTAALRHVQVDLAPPPGGARSPAQEHDLDGLLAALPDAVVLVSAARSLVAANGRGHALLAATGGTPGPDSFIRGPVAELVDRALVSGQPQRSEVFTTRDDNRAYVQVHVHPAAISGAAAVLTLLDVTEERLIQERLLQSEKMASVGQLVSGVAHELNNPLTGIMGFAQLLLQQELPAQVERQVSTIFQEAERAARIVQNLLSFARRRRPDKEPVDLNELIERTLELRSYELRVHNIEIELQLAPRVRAVMADPHQIQQVLLNVIANAEQAMKPQRGGLLTIRTADRRGWVECSIADTGPGIPAEHLLRVFDPFFTTKEPGEGTGLGLTICYGIVAEEHGGRIRAENLPAGGVGITIELPAFDGAALGGGEAIDSAEEQRTPARRILVVDDEQTIRDLLTGILQLDGHAVTCAETGDAAWELLREGGYDLVITDVKMPGISGLELYHRIEAERPELAERFVFTTGDTVSPQTRNELDASGRAVLAKPFSLRDVRHLVLSLVEPS